MPLSWFGIKEPIYSRHDFEGILDKFVLPSSMFLDLRYEQNTVIKYTLYQDSANKPPKLKEFISQKTGIGSRVISPYTRVFSSTPYTMDIDAFISTQIRRAQNSFTLPIKQPFHLAKEKQVEGDFNFFNYEPQPEHVKILAQNILSLLREKLPPQSRLTINVDFNEKYMVYTNSEGTLFSKKEPVWMVTLKVFANNKDAHFRFGWAGKPTNFPEKLFSSWIERSRPFFELPTIKVSSLPKPKELVLSPEATWSVVHEGIGHAVEADLVLQGKSYLAGKLGHKLVSSNITIIDDPGVETASFYQVDDEGGKARGSLLIDEGILEQYLTNRETASELEMISTGNARTPSYEHDYYVRQSNLYIEPQDASEEELFEHFTGLFLLNSMNAVTDTNTGIISLRFSHGIYFENGEMKNWVRMPSIRGVINQLLGDVPLIGKWVEPSAGYCMKAGSIVPVGSISPMIRTIVNKIVIMEGSD